jgi:hypothetical protein
MAELVVNERQTDVQQISGLVRGFRWFYWLCASLVVVGIILQVFFAGASLLVDGSYLITHRIFAHIVELVIFVLLLVGLPTRFSWRIQGLGLLLLLLMFLQYVFLYAVPNTGFPVLRALHAVNALAMFWLALILAQRTWRLTRQ